MRKKSSYFTTFHHRFHTIISPTRTFAGRQYQDSSTVYGNLRGKTCFLGSLREAEVRMEVATEADDKLYSPIPSPFSSLSNRRNIVMHRHILGTTCRSRSLFLSGVRIFPTNGDEEGKAESDTTPYRWSGNSDESSRFSLNPMELSMLFHQSGQL